MCNSGYKCFEQGSVCWSWVFVLLQLVTVKAPFNSLHKCLTTSESYLKNRNVKFSSSTFRGWVTDIDVSGTASTFYNSLKVLSKQKSYDKWVKLNIFTFFFDCKVSKSLANLKYISIKWHTTKFPSNQTRSSCFILTNLCRFFLEIALLP